MSAHPNRRLITHHPGVWILATLPRDKNRKTTTHEDVDLYKPKVHVGERANGPILRLIQQLSHLRDILVPGLPRLERHPDNATFHP